MSWTYGQNKRSGLNYGPPPSLMKRTYPQPFTTKQQRFAKIAANPKSMQNRNRSLVLYKPMPPQRFQRSTPTESNYVDFPGAAYAFDTTGTIALINTVAQGAATNQRIGKKWLMKSLQMRGVCISGNTTTYADAAIIFVYDKRPTGVLPAITDILVTASSFSMNNDNNSGRFRIVRRFDNTFIGNILTPQTGQEAWNPDTWFRLNMPVTNKAAGTGAIGDIEEGALYVITVGNVGAGTAAALGNLQFRIRFTDV